MADGKNSMAIMLALAALGGIGGAGGFDGIGSKLRGLFGGGSDPEPKAPDAAPSSQHNTLLDFPDGADLGNSAAQNGFPSQPSSPGRMNRAIRSLTSAPRATPRPPLPMPRPDRAPVQSNDSFSSYGANRAKGSRTLQKIVVDALSGVNMPTLPLPEDRSRPRDDDPSGAPQARTAQPNNAKAPSDSSTVPAPDPIPGPMVPGLPNTHGARVSAAPILPTDQAPASVEDSLFIPPAIPPSESLTAVPSSAQPYSPDHSRGNPAGTPEGQQIRAFIEHGLGSGLMQLNDLIAMIDAGGIDGAVAQQILDEQQAPNQFTPADQLFEPIGQVGRL